jgi:protein gp37
MTDLAGEWRTVEDLAENIAECIMPTKKGAEYLWLTKRVKRMCDALHYVGDRLNRPDLWFMDNYFGFTAENQEWYNKRFRESRLLPDWANWWISAEPLLGPVDLGLSVRHPVTGAFGVIPHLPSWLVVGCESGPNRRSCKIEWVESIVEQCRNAGVPVFVKQICLPNGKFTNKIEEFPKHLQIRQVPWL